MFFFTIERQCTDEKIEIYFKAKCFYLSNPTRRRYYNVNIHFSNAMRLSHSGKRIKSSNLFAHSKHVCAIHQENLSTFHFLPKYKCYTFYQCLWFSYVNRLKLFTTVKYTKHTVLEWKIIYLNLLKLICLSQYEHWHSQCPIKNIRKTTDQLLRKIERRIWWVENCRFISIEILLTGTITNHQ